MCQECEANGIDIEKQRRELAEEIAKRTGVTVAAVMDVLLAIEEYREEYMEKQRLAALAAARDANPELFAMLEAAGAEFAVTEVGAVQISPSGEPEPEPAHSRDVPEPRRGMYL